MQSIASLRARNEELEALVREFAKCSFPASRPDESIVIQTPTHTLTVGMFRRAYESIRDYPRESVDF